ncbi:MAG: hypothetical protein ABEH59_11190 [Halobacteriales archaeon]
MSLSVGEALRDGFRRTFQRNGVLLMVVFVGLRGTSAIAADTLTRANLELARQFDTLPGSAAPNGLQGIVETPTPYALPVSVGTALVLGIAVALLAEAVRIVAVRTLVSDRTDAVPPDFMRRNIGLATLNAFVGGIVVLTLTVIGLVALILPGLFVALSFFFVRQEVAVRDVNFVDAMAGSWELAAGHRLELLGLAAALVLIGLVASIPGFLIGFVSPGAGSIIGILARAVVIVFGVASVARAYDQLRGEDEAPDTTDDEPTYEGALSAEDLPPPEETSP